MIWSPATPATIGAAVGRDGDGARPLAESVPTHPERRTEAIQPATGARERRVERAIAVKRATSAASPPDPRASPATVIAPSGPSASAAARAPAPNGAAA